MKKRILIVNEFSQLSTGFSTYMKYLLPILFQTDKFEIAEQATYIDIHNPAIHTVPWKIYPNHPNPHDPNEVKLFESNPINQFGYWKFDEICLDFRPDIVVSIRDPWMDDWIVRSPYRKNFKWIHMPTCDGEPQKPEWIETYKNADLILTYSLWAKNVLEKQSGGHIKVFDVASPGSDLNIFKPEDKNTVRTQYGLENDLFILMTVMRNQPRKLYPELFKGFAHYLEICKQNDRQDLINKSFLYCHTSNPDVGWDIPSEMTRYGISHKVLFTYMCEKCQYVYPSFFQGNVAICKNCVNCTAKLPNTMRGVNRDLLAKIMSCADIYIQYSITEGYGMPLADAKACGVPIMAVDCSAMSEQALSGGGIPIKVERMFQEPVNATNQWRCLPDNKDMAEKLFNFACLSRTEQQKLGQEARQCMEKYHSWPMIADIWEHAIDSLDVPDQLKTWLSEPQFTKPNMNIPNNLNNEQFVEWCYKYVVQEPQMLFSALAQKTIASLNLGYEIGQLPDGRQVQNPVDRNKVVQGMMQHVQQKNILEQYRYDKLVSQKDKRPQMTMAEI